MQTGCRDYGRRWHLQRMQIVSEFAPYSIASGATDAKKTGIDPVGRVSYALPPMHRSIFAIFWFVVLAGAVAPVRADDLLLTPREGVVLLANGELIAGKIIPAGDRIDVHLESGEICLRRSDVALICRDAEECYRHKRNDIEVGRVQDHLDLAEWCIRNQLFTQAESELADARKADPLHPRLRLIAARLQLAQQPRPSESAPVIEQAVAHVPLDNLARNLPPGTMETFTNTIQPLLLNYCSKSGCHSSRQDGGLKLERVHPRFSGRSTTQRNLERVIALIDRENPPASLLLQAPIRPHGPVSAAIFTDRQHGQYRQLVQWTYAVAGSRLPTEQPTLAERTAPLLQSIPGASGTMPPATGIPQELPADETAAPLEEELSPAMAPISVDELPPPSSADQAFTPEQLQALGIDPYAPGPNPRMGVSPPQRGAKLPQTFAPRDEFDPEIFNRRFFAN